MNPPCRFCANTPLNDALQHDPLGHRAANILNRDHITTLKELRDVMNDHEGWYLLDLPGMGNTTFERVMWVMRQHRLGR